MIHARANFGGEIISSDLFLAITHGFTGEMMQICQGPRKAKNIKARARPKCRHGHHTENARRE